MTATTTPAAAAASTPPSSNASSSSNPLKDDPELRRLLLELDNIDSKKGFRRWRNSFLQLLETYVDEQHCKPAQEKYQGFSDSMGGMSRLVKKLYGHLDAGHLTVERTTVRARKCLSDLQQQLEQVNKNLFGMLPKTNEQEKQLGYSKFHLGAVLVRDGFVEYDRLVICDEILQHMRSNGLAQVADRQVLDNMDHYHDRLGMFCDVMADLGLYKVMVKCRELLQQEEDEDEEDDRHEAEQEQEQEEEQVEEATKEEPEEHEPPVDQVKETPVKEPPPPTEQTPKKKTSKTPASPTTAPRKSAPKPRGKFEVQLEPVSPTKKSTKTKKAEPEEEEDKPDLQSSFSKFGDYYQGNNDWRIAATLKKERADKQQEKEKAKGDSKETKTPTKNKKKLVQAEKEAKLSNVTAVPIPVKKSDNRDKEDDGNKAPPMDNVRSKSAQVEDLGMESVHANLLPPASPHAQGDGDGSDSNSDSEDSDSDSNSVDLSTISDDWGRISGPRGPDGRPKMYRTLSGIKNENEPAAGAQPRRRGGKKPGYLAAVVSPTKTSSKNNAAASTPAKASATTDATAAAAPAMASSKTDVAPAAAGKQPQEGAHGPTAVSSNTAPPAASSLTMTEDNHAKDSATPRSKANKQQAVAAAAPASDKSDIAEASPATETQQEGDLPVDPMPYNHGEEFGYAVALSQDGSILATGSPRHGKGGKGRARIFYWDEDEEDWVQLGQELFGKTVCDAFGTSVSISNDGQVLAVGSPQLDQNDSKSGYVICYQYIEENNYWSPMGSTLVGSEIGDTFGWSVSLSGNGKRLVVGGPQSRQNTGCVNVFDWDGATWKQRGGSLRGDALLGSSVAMSSNGKMSVAGCNKAKAKNFKTIASN